MSVLALDPGNSTGWCMRDDDGNLIGGTLGASHAAVWRLLSTLVPDVVIFETFQMYPGKAQKLIWNTFYPCEVIGVIKLYCEWYCTTIVGLQPSVKKYALSDSEINLWKSVTIKDFDEQHPVATEHTRDAVRLLRYYERNKKTL